jgi:hypothetical protein
MSRTRLAIVLSALLILAAGTAPAEPARIANGATPAHGVRTIQLAPQWEVGGEDGDLILGVVTQVLIDQENNVYLLDGQLAEVHVISPAGELLRTIGREGDGPGEFRQPGDMAFLPDGTLGVMQAFPGKIIRIDPLDGTPAGEWTLGDAEAGGFFEMRAFRQAAGNIVVGGVHQIIDQPNGRITRQDFLGRVDPATGLVTHHYAERDVVIELAAIRLDENDLTGGPGSRYDVLADGRVAVAIPRNGYEVSVFAPGGELELVFTREYESWQRDDQALGIWQRILETIQRTQVPGAPLSWEQTEPDVQSLRGAPDGRIWIQNAHGRWAPPAGVFASYDVFTPDGRFDEQVHVTCDGDPRSDALFFSGSDYVFRVAGFWDAALARFGGAGTTTDEEEEPAPVAVTCYRIES